MLTILVMSKTLCRSVDEKRKLISELDKIGISYQYFNHDVQIPKYDIVILFESCQNVKRFRGYHPMYYYISEDACPDTDILEYLNSRKSMKIGEFNAIIAMIKKHIEREDLYRSPFFVGVGKSVSNALKKSVNSYYGLSRVGQFAIKRVIFNKPYTIVIWEDKTKTIVKTQGSDKYDPEKGLAMAISKKALGTNKTHSDYYDVFKKWLPKKTKKGNK